jgi:hypothetical protein
MAHRWKFFRAGGFDQVRLETGADLAALPELDPKLWVALACPAKGLELDSHLLTLLDSDADERIRVPEVLEATTWACKLLKQPDELFRANAALPLSSIHDGSQDGQAVLASAQEILRNLGRPHAETITAEDTADTVKIFASTRFNGDGIIPPESAGEDAETAAVLKDIIACFGPDKDMSGLDGVSRAKVERFFSDARSFVDWWSTGEGNNEILVLGAATPDAFAACQAVRAKLDDYFARCGLASMDPAAARALNPPESAYQQLGTLELSHSHAKVAELPVARVEAGRDLPLTEGLNPAWADAVKALRLAVVAPLLGAKTTLSADEWTRLLFRLAAYQDWLATKPPVAVEKLGIVRLRALLSGGVRAKIEALLSQDEALETAAKAITSVDRLATYYVHLVSFLDNFVSFKDFYTRKRKAAFQAGTLYLDGRSCELCLRVGDVGQHAALAPLSMTCLAYCDCTRKGSAEKMSIVAAVTGGDSDFLRVGRNGVFYDRKGQDWDATIARVVAQPIGLRQAFWAPYKRAALFVSEQTEKIAGARDKQASEVLHPVVQHVAGGALAPPTAPPPATAFDVAKFAGVFAAIGLAVGMVGSALAALVTGFWGLAAWQMPLALAGAAALISSPSLALATMKLRKRNLAPLLDASGWAINARAVINIPFGGSLTGLAALPPGSERALRDPFAPKRRPWGLYAFLVALVALGLWFWLSGHLGRLFNALHFR